MQKKNRIKNYAFKLDKKYSADDLSFADIDNGNLGNSAAVHKIIGDSMDTDNDNRDEILFNRNGFNLDCGDSRRKFYSSDKVLDSACINGSNRNRFK